MKGIRRSFKVEGLNLERFVCMTATKNIVLCRVERTDGRTLTACTDESFMQELAAMAAEGGWRMTLGERQGAGRALDLLKRRWLAAAAAAVFGLLLMLSTQILWHIEIIGADSYRAELSAALKELGVSVPMPRSRLEPGRLQEALEWRYPQVAWFECGLRGMTLEIRAVEGRLPGEAISGGPCDVIASRDGIVHSIVTRAGTPVVAAGDVVRRGDVLIRGEERTASGMTRPVAARGSVYARVWDTALVRMSAMELQTSYTGRSQTVWTVRSPWFDLWQMEEPAYEQADVSVREQPLGGIFIPLVIRTETRMEAEVARVRADPASLEAQGSAAAMKKLREFVGGKDSLVDNWVNWSMIDDEILLFAATGERIVDVAQQERDSGMAATE
ncbi:MAG: sporulation protein YqfD [Clostridia bacterium]|nr:sporulation protein YqfD [Clostridia bacterium]